MVNRRFTYTDPVITSTRVDNTNTFLWMAFSKNTSGNCIIEKQTAFQPTQTFFTIERAVESVPAMDLSGSFLYVIYDDDTLFAERFSLTNPLTSSTSINIPAGINEVAVDVLFEGSNVWILTPGSASGENAKLLRYNTSLTLQETVDLTKSGATILDASSMTADSNGDIWVVTDTAPAQYVRVYALSGGGYDFTVYETL